MKRSTQTLEPSRKSENVRPNRSWCRGLLAAGVLVASAAAPAAAAGPGVHGRVFALDENGVISDAVPGAVIEITGDGGASATLTASEGGYYRADLPPGRYHYKVTAAGFRDEEFGRGFSLGRSQGYAVYNFSLISEKKEADREAPKTSPPATLTPPPARTAPDAAVVLSRVEPTPVLPPTTRQPEAALPQWRPPRLPSRTLPQPADQRRPIRPSAATLTLLVAHAQAQNLGSMTMTRKAPVAGAQVKVLRIGGLAASGQSDRTGRFATRLAPGVYQVYVAHPSFFPHQETIQVADAGASRLIVLRSRVEASQQPATRLTIPQRAWPDIRSRVKPEATRQTPRATIQPPSPLRQLGQIHAAASQPTAAAAQVQPHGQSSAASPGRLSFDPRRVTPPTSFQMLPNQASASQAQSATTTESRHEAIQRMIRARRKSSLKSVD